MEKIGSIEFKRIKRISPSQFYSMRNCAYKSLLAEAFEKTPLLPISPNAHYGTILHKMLDSISKGEIKDESKFNTRFDAEILLMETDLTQKGYDYFVPLQMNIRDFGIKKIQLKKHFRASNELPLRLSEVKCTSENWFESKDKLIGGYLDLTIEGLDRIEIVDFKTGAITEGIFDDAGESYQEIKGAYRDQLKLYAYLYFDATGKFPTHLSLVDLSKQKFNVEFSEEECKTLFSQAKNLLNETNASIETHEFKAHPSESNCKFCLYRPACSFYLNHLTADDSFNDVCGCIKDVVKYQNGNVTVFVERGSHRISVTGFAHDKYDYFNNNKNREIKLFNLKKESTDFVYSVGKTTKIYE